MAPRDGFTQLREQQALNAIMADRTPASLRELRKLAKRRDATGQAVRRLLTKGRKRSSGLDPRIAARFRLG